MSKFNSFLNKIIAADDETYVNPVEYIGVDGDKNNPLVKDKIQEGIDVNRNHSKIFKDDKNSELFKKCVSIIQSCLLSIIKKAEKSGTLNDFYLIAANALEQIYNLDKDYFSVPNHILYFKNLFLKEVRQYINKYNKRKIYYKNNNRNFDEGDAAEFSSKTANKISNNLRSFVRSNYFKDGRMSLYTFLEFTKIFVELYLSNRKSLNNFFNMQYYNLKNNSIESWFTLLNPIYVKYMYYLGSPYNSITASEKAKFIAESNTTYSQLEDDIKNALRNLYITYEDNKYVPVNVGLSIIGGARGL